MFIAIWKTSVIIRKVTCTSYSAGFVFPELQIVAPANTLLLGYMQSLFRFVSEGHSIVMMFGEAETLHVYTPILVTFSAKNSFLCILSIINGMINNSLDLSNSEILIFDFFLSLFSVSPLYHYDYESDQYMGGYFMVFVIELPYLLLGLVAIER